MVMYDNEFETKKIKFKARIKLNHRIYTDQRSIARVTRNLNLTEMSVLKFNSVFAKWFNPN